MHDRFENAVRLLLAGEFICSISHPEAYRYLRDEGARRDIDHYLGRIGRRMAETRHGNGYYLAFSRIGEDERSQVREQLAEIRNTLAPIVVFFRMVMRATGQEDLLMHGSIIESSQLMAHIDQDPALRNELLTVAGLFKLGAAESSNRSILDRVIARLRGNGYLRLANPERGVYQVTARVEYLLEVMNYLVDNDESLKGQLDEVADEAAEAGRQTLL